MKRLRIPRDAKLKSHVRGDLFGGIVAVTVKAKEAEIEDWSGDLYRTAAPRTGDAKLTAIPYYLWCNRGPGQMLVWIPKSLGRLEFGPHSSLGDQTPAAYTDKLTAPTTKTGRGSNRCSMKLQWQVRMTSNAGCEKAN